MRTRQDTTGRGRNRTTLDERTGKFKTGQDRKKGKDRTNRTGQLGTGLDRTGR